MSNIVDDDGPIVELARNGKMRSVMWRIRSVAAGVAVSVAVAFAVSSCGGSGDGASRIACSGAISNATGAWVTVANNTYTPPGVADKNFFSFNQPSVNSNGMVVFRARAKAAGGGAGGEPYRGV